jgi:hypothetical protein
MSKEIKLHDTVIATKTFRKVPVGARGVVTYEYEISDNILEVEFNVDGKTIIQTMTKQEINKDE